MHLRTAVRSDLSTLATVAASAFLNDEFFAWLCPYRHEYPGDFRAHFLRSMKWRYCLPACRIYIAETEESDVEFDEKKGPEIVAYAIWERSGEDEAGKKWMVDRWSYKIERTLLSVSDWYYEHVAPNRSMSTSSLNIFLTANDSQFDVLPACIHLAFVATLPTFRRKGIGSRLIQWGLDRAMEEQVPVALEASVLGRGVYEKLGFRECARVTYTEELVRLAMIWEPEGFEGMGELVRRHWEEKNQGKDEEGIKC